MCGPGHGISGEGVTGICDDFECQPGESDVQGNGQSCDICAPGTHTGRKASGACTQCVEGKIDNDSAPATPCITCETLAKGYYVAPGSSGSCGRGLFQCGKGTFDDDQNPATPCRNCTQGSVSAARGSFACDMCPEGEFQALPGQTSCNKCQAAAVTLCTAGATYKVECTKTTDTTCHPCTVCNGSTYQASACTVEADAVCQECTVCAEGAEVQEDCSASADRRCSPAEASTGGSTGGGSIGIIAGGAGGAAVLLGVSVVAVVLLKRRTRERNKSTASSLGGGGPFIRGGSTLPSGGGRCADGVAAAAAILPFPSPPSPPTTFQVTLQSPEAARALHSLPLASCCAPHRSLSSHAWPGLLPAPCSPAIGGRVRVPPGRLLLALLY